MGVITDKQMTAFLKLEGWKPAKWPFNGRLVGVFSDPVRNVVHSLEDAFSIAFRRKAQRDTSRLKAARPKRMRTIANTINPQPLVGPGYGSQRDIPRPGP